MPVSAPHKMHVAIKPSAPAEACTWWCFSPTENEPNYREDSGPPLHCDLCHGNASDFSKELIARAIRVNPRIHAWILPNRLGIATKQTPHTEEGLWDVCLRRVNITAQNP
jgi:hypothetical protein